MNIGKLRRAANILGASEMGQWLTKRVDKLDNASDDPNVLVLVSAPREYKKIFLKPWEKRRNWVKLSDSETTETKETIVDFVVESDVLIWIMSASRIFPGTFAEALDAAKQNNTPIWAVLTGMNSIGDMQEFTKVIIPKYKSKLPQNSYIFLSENDENQFPTLIDEKLNHDGKQIASNGQQRRIAGLVSEVRHRCIEEQRRLQSRLQIIDSHLIATEKNIEAMKVMMKPDLPEIVISSNAITEISNSLQIHLEKSLSTQDDLTVENLKEQLRDALEEFLGNGLANFFIEQQLMGEAGIEQWCTKNSQKILEMAELNEMLKPMDISRSSAPPFDSQPIRLKFKVEFDRCQNSILQDYHKLYSLLSDDVLLNILESLSSYQELPRSPTKPAEEESRNPNSSMEDTKDKTATSVTEQYSEGDTQLSESAPAEVTSSKKENKPRQTDDSGNTKWDPQRIQNLGKQIVSSVLTNRLKNNISTEIQTFHNAARGNVSKFEQKIKDILLEEIEKVTNPYLSSFKPIVKQSHDYLRDLLAVDRLLRAHK